MQGGDRVFLLDIALGRIGEPVAGHRAHRNALERADNAEPHSLQGFQKERTVLLGRFYEVYVDGRAKIREVEDHPVLRDDGRVEVQSDVIGELEGDLVGAGKFAVAMLDHGMFPLCFDLFGISEQLHYNVCGMRYEKSSNPVARRRKILSGHSKPPRTTAASSGNN